VRLLRKALKLRCPVYLLCIISFSNKAFYGVFLLGKKNDAGISFVLLFFLLLLCFLPHHGETLTLGVKKNKKRSLFFHPLVLFAL
jgi:hypothetical protein